MTSQYRCSVSWPIKRSKGKSAVAKAAYNSRSQLFNERSGEKTRDYSKPDRVSRGKEDVLFSKIMVDSAIGAPDWVTEDRNRLWNAAVKAQGNRKNALDGAQEMILNLPNDLDLKAHIRMVTDFVRENITRGTGRVADINIHDAPKTGDERNKHAHILFTIRKMGPDGFIHGPEGLLPELTPDDIRRIRLKWAERGARELERAGLPLEAERWREGYRTNEKQADKAEERGDHVHAEDLRDREKTEHLGPEASMNKNGNSTERGRRNEEIKDRNEQRKWDRETAREDKKRGPVAERIFTAYEESSTASGFKWSLEKDNLFLARVTKEDIELYGPDYSDPREELARLEWLQKKGAWMTQTGGYLRLNSEQRMRARQAYDRYAEAHSQDGKKETFTFDGYVKYVQLQTQRQIDHLTEYKRVLDFTDGGHTRKSDFHAKEGEYVVVTKGGFVYRLNQATAGDTPKEVKEFLKDLDHKPIRSVKEARIEAEAMRAADRDKWNAIRMENATRDRRKPAWKVADRGLDKAGPGTLRVAEIAANKVARTFNALATAMGSVADMFTGFFPTQREQERKAAEQEYLKDQQRDHSREILGDGEGSWV